MSLEASCIKSGSHTTLYSAPSKMAFKDVMALTCQTLPDPAIFTRAFQVCVQYASKGPSVAEKKVIR